MKIYVYCEDKNEKTYLDVPEDECTVMIQTDYEKRLREADDGEEVIPRTVQEILDDEINKPTFNNNQTETRRHCSMDTMLEEGFAFVGDEDVTLEDEYASLYQAINELNEEQRELVDMIFFKGMKQKDVASIKGISAPAIAQRMAVIYSQLKKYLKKILFPTLIFPFPVSYLIEGQFYTAFRKGKFNMQTLKIKVSKQKVNGGVLACRSVTVREKLLRFLLGTPIKLTVLVPGDTVSEVTISEGGKDDGHNS